MLHPRSGAIFTRDKNAHKARKRVWESALGSGGNNYSDTLTRALRSLSKIARLTIKLYLIITKALSGMSEY